jgi:type I restriction enzyme M protein
VGARERRLLAEHTSKDGVLVHEDGSKTYTGDLLEAYRRHVQKSMFHGFDFDATMLRIASTNPTLPGVDSPEIHHQDTLSTSIQERYPRTRRTALGGPREPAVRGEPRRGGRPPEAK